MKPVGLISTGVLLLLLGAVAPTYAQQDQHEQDSKAPKQEEQAKPKKQQQDKGQQQKAKGQQQRKQGQQQQQAKGQQDQQRQQQQQAVWQQRRAQNWQSEHRTWQQRGGYNGYRIPDDRYRVRFGPNHWFRIRSYPMELYGGYPRFQYGGFWFGFMDPWPEYWSDDWYDNDDVYIVYSDGGYYLYNRRYPHDRITITVYLN